MPHGSAAHFAKRGPWGSHTSGCAAKATSLVVEDDTRRRFSSSVRPLPRKCRPALTMAHSINGGDENAAGFSSSSSSLASGINIVMTKWSDERHRPESDRRDTRTFTLFESVNAVRLIAIQVAARTTTDSVGLPNS